MKVLAQSVTLDSGTYPRSDWSEADGPFNKSLCLQSAIPEHSNAFIHSALGSRHLFLYKNKGTLGSPPPFLDYG